MLEDADGVDLVARFGAEIHACGKDAAALERAVRAVGQAQPHVEIERIEAGFEEIFIYLMSGSIDNFQ
jgi:ABC-2 type transport system ATP-binding protein